MQCGSWRLFQEFASSCQVFQYLHLLYSDAVQADEPFPLGDAVLYEHSIQTLHVRQAYQFIDGRIVVDVAFQVGMFVAPFQGGHSEECHVQHIGFVGVDAQGLCRDYLLRDEVLLNGIGVNAVIDFRQFPFAFQPNLCLFLLFQPLELRNQVNLELRTYPHGKFKGDVFVGRIYLRIVLPWK